MNVLTVYIHIPFCTVKCGYCDFNAYAGMDRLKGAYFAALLREMEGWRDVLRGRLVTSISFGGGTPGEFAAEWIGEIVGAVGHLAEVEARAEISLEANPGTTTLAYLQELRAAGVNRVSFGAQSFDADELSFLDRIHSPQATAASVALAREAGIASVGLDLIYGLPGQAEATWLASLRRAIELVPDHISCYGLTVEEGTPLARDVAAGTVVPLDPDAVAEMYELAEQTLETAGYEHYEISNWARPGHESRHNSAYWTDAEYLAIGAGAHGYLGGQRYQNVAHPRAYIAATAGTGLTEVAGRLRPAVAEAYLPSRTTAMFDWLETALRLTTGFELNAFERRFGTSLDAVAREPLRRCTAGGLLERTPDRMRLTPRGRLLHSEVMAEVLAHLTRGDRGRAG